MAYVGVVSGSGKGVTAITAVVLSKACGRRVTPIKIDPYLNTDSGTMPPFEHGGYVDLDRGNCKRFLHIKLTRDNYITGKIYQHVIAKKRDGDYLGKTVQPVDDMRNPMNEQENCSNYRPKKSKHTRRTIPSKQEVKEDLLKTQKKGIFITEEAVKRNHKNPPYIYLINTIITLLAFIIIKLVSLEMATTRFSFRSGSRSTTYSSSSLRFDADSCPSSSEGQANPNLTYSPVSYPMRIADSPGKVHQVFLNFRGEQLRYSLVSHVTDGLQRHEIKFFIDEFELRSNDLDHLFVRIEESSIALAFFSTRYSESKFCMDELVKMKERADQGKLRVIPIFYKVKAEDVRNPTHDSEFGTNFWRLAESNADKVKAWTEALECISKKAGFSFREKSSESDFVNKIVKEVKRLKEAIELEEEEKSFLGGN